MPFPDLQIILDSAIQDLESVTGETVNINSTNYACTRQANPFTEEHFEPGGTFIKKQTSLSVRKSLLPVMPQEETPATFSGIGYRIVKVHDNGAYWQIDIQQYEA